MATKKKAKTLEVVDVWQVSKWTCPNCEFDNESVAYPDKSEPIICGDCQTEYQVGGIYSD